MHRFWILADSGDWRTGRILNIEGSTGAVMRATSSRPSSRVLFTAPSSSATLQMPRPVPDGESRGLGG